MAVKQQQQPLKGPGECHIRELQQQRQHATHTLATHTHTSFVSQYSHIRPIVQHQLQQQAAAGHLLPEKTKRSRGITWLQACCSSSLLAALHAVACYNAAQQNILYQVAPAAS